MADLATRMIEEAHGHIRRLSGKLDKSKGTVTGMTSEVVCGLEAVAGGAAAAAVDYFLGEQTPSGIPEAAIGPVPITITAAAVAKIVAIGLVMSEKPDAPSLEKTSHHVGRLADGLLAGASALTGMRIMLESGVRTIPAATAGAPTV